MPVSLYILRVSSWPAARVNGRLRLLSDPDRVLWNVAMRIITVVTFRCWMQFTHAVFKVDFSLSRGLGERVTWGKVLNLSKPWIPCVENEMNTRIKINNKGKEVSTMYSKCLVNVSYCGFYSAKCCHYQSHRWWCSKVRTWQFPWGWAGGDTQDPYSGFCSHQKQL